MSKYLNSEQKEIIKKRIESIEAKSSAEIVVAVTEYAKGYGYLTLIYTLVFTLLFALLYLILGYEVQGLLFVEIVVATYLFIYFVLSNSSLMSKITPKSLTQKRCEKFALSQFVKQGVDKTSNHKAILIFVCLKSKYIRIVADKEIDKIVSNDTWQNIVTSFIQRAKDDRITDGILEAVNICGEILTKNFPRDEESKDELSNTVLEV